MTSAAEGGGGFEMLTVADNWFIFDRLRRVDLIELI